MNFHLAEKTVARLLELPSPYEQTDWWENGVAYLDDCDFGQNDVVGLLSVLECWTDQSADAANVFFDDEQGITIITAWRLIGKLKAASSLPLMLRCLSAAAGDDEGEDDCWETQDLPQALVLLGPDIAGDLMAFAADSTQPLNARIAVLESIKNLAEQHPTIVNGVSPRLITALENASENPVGVNTELMGLAIDWKLAEAAEAIERAFSLNKIDCGYFGNWEAIRRELHVEGLGLDMPDKPFNSLDDFRRNVGIGCFSKEMLFKMGEFDDQAVQTYLNEACRAFSVSLAGKRLIGKRVQHPMCIYSLTSLSITALSPSIR